ncbi:MAG: hypothetical protein ABJN57_13580 [Hyphomicrobiales bacterium]
MFNNRTSNKTLLKSADACGGCLWATEAASKEWASEAPLKVRMLCGHLKHH